MEGLCCSFAACLHGIIPENTNTAGFEDILEFCLIKEPRNCFASVNSSCAPLPAPLPLPRLTFQNFPFFLVDGKFPGAGALKLSNARRWERK